MFKKIYIYIILCVIVTVFLINLNSDQLIETVFSKNTLEPIRNGSNNEYIAFTCNVDWGTELIPKMLDIFDKYSIKITFFVSGKWAEKNPDILKEIYNRGHEIGNHGYGHRMHSKISREDNYNEIMNTHKVIKDLIGIDMDLFAPPSGDYGDITLEVANKLNYKTILWNIDTIDWRKDSSSQKIIERVLSKPLKGSIVLMHPKKETLKALETIIKSIHERNIKIGRINDILN